MIALSHGYALQQQQCMPTGMSGNWYYTQSRSNWGSQPLWWWGLCDYWLYLIKLIGIEGHLQWVPQTQPSKLALMVASINAIYGFLIAKLLPSLWKNRLGKSNFLQLVVNENVTDFYIFKSVHVQLMKIFIHMKMRYIQKCVIDNCKLITNVHCIIRML